MRHFFKGLADGTDKELKELKISTETRTFLEERSKTLPEGFTVVPSDAAKEASQPLQISKILRLFFWTVSSAQNVSMMRCLRD